MVGVGGDLCGSTSPTPLPKQGHLQQAAQDLVQAGLEYLHRRRLHNLPAQPVPGLRHPQSEEVLPHVQMELPVPQFVFVLFCTNLSATASYSSCYLPAHGSGTALPSQGVSEHESGRYVSAGVSSHDGHAELHGPPLAIFVCFQHKLLFTAISYWGQHDSHLLLTSCFSSTSVIRFCNCKQHRWLQEIHCSELRLLYRHKMCPEAIRGIKNRRRRQTQIYRLLDSVFIHKDLHSQAIQLFC